MSQPTPSRRDVIDAIGPDTVKFLHAIVSQDIASMTDGETRWSFLLTPQGRVVSHFRVVRIDGENLSLDVEAGHGALLESSLRRYLIRTKCTLTLRADQLTWWFPDSSDAVALENGRVVEAHPLLGGVEVFGLSTVPAGAEDFASSQRNRVIAGLPAMGAELDDRSIPNGTGLLPWAVSFSKGCYIGQELVERIDSRSGTTPARLVRLSFAEPPDTDDADDADRVDEVGRVDDRHQKRSLRVTSVAANGAAWVGIGWAPRSVAVGDVVDGALVVGEVGEV